jgi:hypothetical protein
MKSRILVIATTMEVYFKTKENWQNILKLLDEHL